MRLLTPCQTLLWYMSLGLSVALEGLQVKLVEWRYDLKNDNTLVKLLTYTRMCCMLLNLRQKTMATCSPLVTIISLIPVLNTINSNKRVSTVREGQYENNHYWSTFSFPKNTFNNFHRSNHVFFLFRQSLKTRMYWKTDFKPYIPLTPPLGIELKTFRFRGEGFNSRPLRWHSIVYIFNWV